MTKNNPTFFSRSLLTGVPRDDNIALVASTLMPSAYAQPLEVDYENENSGRYMPLYREWAQQRRLGRRRTLIWWKNYMRANVRQDSRVFSEQLIGW